MENKEIYTVKYFQGLGLSKREASSLVKNWNRHEPQTMTEVRQGIVWERENRERTIFSDRP